MEVLRIYVLFFCIILATTELVGPEASNKEKNDEEPTEVPDTEDPEYYNEITSAMRKEIKMLQEYADAMRKSKELLKDEDTKGKFVFFIVLTFSFLVNRFIFITQR